MCYWCVFVTLCTLFCNTLYSLYTFYLFIILFKYRFVFLNILIMKDKRIHVTLKPEVKDRLEKASEITGYSISVLVGMALERHLVFPVPLDLAQHPIPIKDCYKVEDLSPPLSELKPLENPEHEGLVVGPIMERVRPKQNLGIETAFSTAIKPGPGVTQRLKANGVEPIDVIKARRNKSMGREYNTSLEKYFELFD